MASNVTISLTLPDGTRKYYRGKTKKEAEAKRDKDAKLLGLGVDITDNPTFQMVGERWFSLTKDTDDLHIRTKETLQGTLARYVYPALGEKNIRDIRPMDIMLMMKSIGSKSNSTQRKVLQATRAICAFAVDNNLIVKSPVLDSLKAGGAVTEEVTPLTDAQCRRLLKATEGTRVHLFVELLLLTGLRKGEALGLMWQDIDFKRAMLRVERSVVYPVGNRSGEINTELKTSAARRMIPIVPELLADLKAEKEKSKSLYVFHMKNGSFLSESSFRKMWDLIRFRSFGTESELSRLPKTIDFDVHPHQLRHTCVTRWIEHGLAVKEVQYLAGHATPDVTMRIYAHYRREQEINETAARMAAFSGKLAAEC